MRESIVFFLGWGLKGQLGMLKQQNSNYNLVTAFKKCIK